jgi:hypothetical protein
VTRLPGDPGPGGKVRFALGGRLPERNREWVWIRIAVPGLFLICSVGIVAMYADDIRVSRLRRHGIEPPDDPDLGRPSHLRGAERRGAGRRGAGWVAGGRGSARSVIMGF